MQAVILILKHALFLRLSNSQDTALTNAGLDFQKADINLKIQDYLKAYSPEHSIEESASFIMATDICMFIFVFVILPSHQSF